MASVDKEKLGKFQKGELKFTDLFSLDSNQIASLLLCGHNFFSQGKFEEAKSIFEGLAILDPQNPYLHSILGAIYQKIENYSLAVMRYTRAIELFPGDINSLTNRGEIYLNLGKFQEAASDLKMVIELDLQKKNPSANRARLLIVIAAESLQSAKNRKTS